MVTVKKKSKAYTDKINKIVKMNLKEANLISQINHELLFRLSASKTQNFSKLLDQLENQRDSLGISNVSINANSIEQVFLK